MTPTDLIKNIVNEKKITIHFNELLKDVKPQDIPLLMNRVQSGCTKHKCNYNAMTSSWTFEKEK